MTYTTAADKELVRHNLVRYTNAGKPMTISSVIRLQQWLEGKTFKEIAEEEGVTDSAVAYSVKRSVKAIKAFALQSPSGYNGKI